MSKAIALPCSQIHSLASFNSGELKPNPLGAFGAKVDQQLGLIGGDNVDECISAV